MEVLSSQRCDALQSIEIWPYLLTLVQVDLAITPPALNI
jgi:hypothetical protein